MRSFSLSWRRVALVCALLMAAASVVALRSSPFADAQQPTGSQTVISSGILVTANNGHATLPIGASGGVFGIACTGAAPRTGNLIPGQVVIEFGFNDTRLRIIRNDGIAITGTVRINCVIEIDLSPEAAATVERLKATANAG
jgi:hypothetical protein